MARKKKSLVEEGLNSWELPQDVLSSSNSRRFCRQQRWHGTCGADTGTLTLVPGDLGEGQCSVLRQRRTSGLKFGSKARQTVWFVAAGAQHRGWWLGCGSWGALSGLRILGGARGIQSDLRGCPGSGQRL